MPETVKLPPDVRRFLTSCVNLWTDPHECSAVDDGEALDSTAHDAKTLCDKYGIKAKYPDHGCGDPDCMHCGGE